MTSIYSGQTTHRSYGQGSAVTADRLYSKFGLGLVALLPPLVLFAIVGLQPWLPVFELLRDPLAVAEGVTVCCETHYGAVSNLGSMIWAAGAAVCLFTAACLWLGRREPKTMRFMLCAGLLTGLLGADDLFLIHDHVLPAVGVPQMAIYAVYGMLGFGFLAVFLRPILAHAGWLFLLAGGALAASIAVDQFIENEAVWRILLEDGLKFAGLWAWCLFFTVRAAAVLAFPSYWERG
jgi:hypothetical protein